MNGGIYSTGNEIVDENAKLNILEISFRRCGIGQSSEKAESQI